MSDWQTIDNAPKDGTVILLWSRHAPKVGVVAGAYDIKADLPWRFVEYFDWIEGNVDPFNAFLKEPTHWRPIPAAPEGAA